MNSQSPTPPALKWLLNERAALAGATRAKVGKQFRLAEEIGQAALKMEVLEASLAALNILHAQRMETLAALDNSIRLVNHQVNPAAGGCVNAWQGRYGKRGAAKQYVLGLLRDAGPSALPIKYLVSCFAEQFNLPLESKEDCLRIRRVVTTKLKWFRTKGLAESLHKGNSPGLWRLSSPPGMAGLLNLTAKQLPEP